jgi:stage IV sporulation protein FB
MLLMLFLGNGRLAVFSAIFSCLHEYAHAWMAQRLGYSPAKISAGLFGGVLHLKEGYIKPAHGLLIHSAGPFINLCVALAGFIILSLTGWEWIYDIVAANLVLALFNLMPFYPLDGGKLAGIYLTHFVGYRKAYIISKIFSVIFSVLLFLLGLYLVQYNIVNLLICALAINLYMASREDSKYSFYRLMSIYTALEKENRI